MSVAIYEQLTAGRTRFLRVDELCRLASEKGALPSVSDLAAEAARSETEGRAPFSLARRQSSSTRRKRVRPAVSCS